MAVSETYSEEWIKEHSMDRGRYPLIISKDLPSDFSIPNHPEYFLSEPHNPNVRIELTTFRGICGGAIHYYAQIKVSQPTICCIGENGRQFSCFGYICKEFQDMPREIKDNIGGMYDICVARVLSQREIDSDPVRWNGYRKGYQTDAFPTSGEALRVAKIIAAYRFPGRPVEVEELF